MFSGFDFKRFSLDALQDEENEESTPLSVVPEHAERSERTETPPPQQKLPSTDEEPSEWDWDHDNAASQVERNGPSTAVGAVEQRQDARSQRAHNVEGDSSSAATPTAVMSVGAASPAELEQTGGEGNPDAGKPGDTGQEGGAEQERRDVRVVPEANNAHVVSVKEEIFSTEMVRVQLVRNCWRSSQFHNLQVDTSDGTCKYKICPKQHSAFPRNDVICLAAGAVHRTAVHRSHVRGLAFGHAFGTGRVSTCCDLAGPAQAV